MTVASRTREAAREQPFLLDALRAGVVNYRAAAEFLAVEGDPESVATALRRFAADLDAPEAEARDARVTMHRGVGLDGDGEALLSVGGAAVADGGSLTAVQAAGEVDARALEGVLGRLRTAGVEVEAAGVADGALLVVVGRRAGAKAVRLVEAALEEAA